MKQPYLKQIFLLFLSLLILTGCGVISDNNSESGDRGTTTNNFQLEAWADNWFIAFLDDDVIVEDSVSITTERSFNSETAIFSASYPFNLNFILKDFKENDTGLEYIGERNQQMGDGGFIMQIKDLDSGEIVAVSDDNMKCSVIHQAPLDNACAKESNPVASVVPCTFFSIEEPADWKNSSFDTGNWDSATEYSESAVNPKGGYDDISWDSSAKLIWGSDLEQDNTLLCKLTVEDSSNSNSSNSKCGAISNSVSAAGFSDVTVSCDDTYAYIISDTYPDHDLMNGITGTNEQIPVPAPGYAAPIVLNPSGTSNTTTIDASLGVAINGVPIYDYSSQGDLDVFNYDSNKDTYLLGQLDNCGGHAGRGDDYHYHKRPNCMIDTITSFSDDMVIGWAYDGYPIFDLKNTDGTDIRSGELDICNGQEDDLYGYSYHTSQSAPYILKCLRGNVEQSVLPRVAPMNGRTTGNPPAGGVSSLTFSEQNGLVRMEYLYLGINYYMQYEASSTPGCFVFETKTVTEGGMVSTGEFCR